MFWALPHRTKGWGLAGGVGGLRESVSSFCCLLIYRLTHRREGLETNGFAVAVLSVAFELGVGRRDCGGDFCLWE